MKITKVYTKTGDNGHTSLVGGERVEKCHDRIEAYGAIDELNSHVGLLASLTDGSMQLNLQRIQCCLFNIGTYLATDLTSTPLYNSGKLDICEIEWLEKQIDTMTDELPEQRGFILPGGIVAASQAHVCRTVCRRVERHMVRLSCTCEISAEYLQYINRLSDFFFMLAKKINFIEGYSEKLWINYCKSE